MKKTMYQHVAEGLSYLLRCCMVDLSYAGKRGEVEVIIAVIMLLCYLCIFVSFAI